jgi:FkbM family methyltransferase
MNGNRHFGAARRYLRMFGFAGALKAVVAQATRSVSLCRAAIPGSRHGALLRVPSSDLSTYYQVFTQRDYDFRVESAPRVIVDAGANIGLAAICFASRFPQAKIIAIEPEQGNYDLLVRNVAPYPNIQPLRAALWNRNEEIDLLDPGRGAWGFTTEASHSREDRTARALHTVRGLTVDALMAEYGLDGIDLLKIDIEGAEREVFEDTSAWIGRVRSLIVELHEHYKPGCNRSFQAGSPGFDSRWERGENIFLARGEYLAPAAG